MVYRIFGAPVRAATGEVNSALVGKVVTIVTRDTTTPFPIVNGANDPIPGSNLIVESGHVVSPFGFESATPTSVYLDWYIEETGDRGQIWFEEVLRQIAIDAQGAVQSVNGLTPDEAGNVTIDLSGGGTLDHGALFGREDDDHPQYLTEARGDDRYPTREAAGSLVANSVAAAAPANRARENHTGTQSISTVTNLESRLAALEAGGGGGAGILLIPEGDDVPLGTPPGLVGYIPSGVVPTPTLFESVSYDSEGTTVSCPVPNGVQIGDAIVFIPGFDPASTATDNIVVSDAGWVEAFDYSPNHSRETAVYVYQVEDATDLANLGSTVSATYGASGRRMGACFTIPGSLVASAWPAYGSGSNRSAATINSNSTTGCSIQGFATATVAFHKVVLFTMHDAASSPAASDGFTVLGYATGSAGGAEARTLTVMMKDLASAPIPAATVTHATATSSTHGGGQFIVPVA